MQAEKLRRIGGTRIIIHDAVGRNHRIRNGQPVRGSQVGGRFQMEYGSQEMPRLVLELASDSDGAGQVGRILATKTSFEPLRWLSEASKAGKLVE